MNEDKNMKKTLHEIKSMPIWMLWKKRARGTQQRFSSVLLFISIDPFRQLALPKFILPVSFSQRVRPLWHHYGRKTSKGKNTNIYFWIIFFILIIAVSITRAGLRKNISLPAALIIIIAASEHSDCGVAVGSSISNSSEKFWENIYVDHKCKII